MITALIYFVLGAKVGLGLMIILIKFQEVTQNK